MRNFDFGRRSGRDNSFRRGNRGDGRMYDAVCSECGKDCQVPFRPSGEKPVFCSECFEKQNGGRKRESRGGEFRGRDSRSDGGRRGGGIEVDKLMREMEKIDRKLERVLGLLDKRDVGTEGQVGKSKKGKKSLGLAEVVASLKTNEKTEKEVVNDGSVEVDDRE